MKVTTVPNKKDIDRKWYIIDAKDQILGRLATNVADYLRGKHKVHFTPHVDCGDYIVIINADKIKTTGAKLADKKYYSHSGYVGGIKEISLGKLMEKKPTKALEKAIFGMIPRNRLKKDILKKLKIFAGEELTHAAQQPEPLEF